MTSTTAPRHRPRLVVLIAMATVVVTVLAVAGYRVLWGRQHQGQALSIRDDRPDGSAAWPRPVRTPATPPATPDVPPFVTSVSDNGRYFLDQYGRPLLVRGDAPWAMATRLSPDQARLWFANREQLGVNAAIISLVGAVANGAPHDDGSTFDGLRPFAQGDVLQWQEPYWDRVTAYLRMAADHGITVMLYPIDGWTIGHAFVPTSLEQCRLYGRKVALRFRDLPNIVWMSGGDYFSATTDLARGSDVDRCIDAMMRGIRGTGDVRLFSMQLGYLKSISTENPYWARRVDWNFVYTYFPTYRAVLEAYRRTPAVPALLGESNYEGENNQTASPPTTDATLRRQVLWSLTSGAAGEFVGSDDWEFRPGWQTRLDTRAMAQIARLRRMFSALPWWQLVPATGDELVTGGRGTELTTDEPMDVLDNDYATAARTADGRLAVVYLPTRRTISIRREAVPAATRATWVDPTSGARHPVRMASAFTSPGTNAAGDPDWILLLTS